jgi:hypothetical protein
MNTSICETETCELTIDELDGVSGGKPIKDSDKLEFLVVVLTDIGVSSGPQGK